MESRDPAPTDPFEELVSALRAALSPVLNPPSASASPMALPTTYSGEAVECGGFLLQLSLFIEMQPQQFASERSKVAFLISLLSGRALLWARAIWNSQSGIINSFDAFTTHFREVFDLCTGSLSIADQLIRLRQGTSSVSGILWMEWDGAAHCLSAGSSSPDQSPDGRVWGQRWSGGLHANGSKNFPATHSLLAQRNRSFTSLTHCLSSSTRTHAAGLQPTHSCWAWATSHHWIMPILRSIRALHPKVPFSSPTPSGEYSPGWTRDLYLAVSNSPTTHPSPFHFSIRPYWLWFLREFHLPRPLNLLTSAPHIGNHSWKWLTNLKW